MTTSLDEHGRQASADRCSGGLPQAQHRPPKRLSAPTTLPYTNSLSISFRGINAAVCFFFDLLLSVLHSVREKCVKYY
ncbi:hypothetical protein [Ruminococcus sp.]|uniref:hypothetical protein n=1 Tax=Ruminococcus sp. TaxID=41978 RepID=UPI00258604DC|nr:hypothetical protein [Ruminococcus sp.]MCR5020895.1 hypothetical protein [Ruminococcus sp.]